jgi:hypothetical protein
MRVTDFTERSPAATRKGTSRRTDDGLPVHSFRSLLNDLATGCLNKVSLPRNRNYLFLLNNVLGVGNGRRMIVAETRSWSVSRSGRSIAGAE